MLSLFLVLSGACAGQTHATPSGVARDYLIGERMRFSPNGDLLQSFVMALNRTVIPELNWYRENTTLVGNQTVLSFSVTGHVKAVGDFVLFGEGDSSFRWTGRFFEGDSWDWQSLVGSATDTASDGSTVCYGTQGSWRPALRTAYGSHQVTDCKGKLLYIDVARGQTVTEVEYASLMAGYGSPKIPSAHQTSLRMHL